MKGCVTVGSARPDSENYFHVYLDDYLELGADILHTCRVRENYLETNYERMSMSTDRVTVQNVTCNARNMLVLSCLPVLFSRLWTLRRSIWTKFLPLGDLKSNLLFFGERYEYGA